MPGRHRKKLGTLLFCIHMALGPLAYAESTKLSLPDLESMMFGQSPALRSAASAVDAARAGVETARTMANPHIEVMNGTRKPRPGIPEVNGNLRSISLTQDLDMPWHRLPRVEGAMASDARATSNPSSQTCVRNCDCATTTWYVAQPKAVPHVKTSS